MSHLFSEFRLRDVMFANRIGVSPMCQYSCDDGLANDWHFAHLAARAVGGAGLVFTEAAAVTPEGRISPQDLGVWDEKHFEPLQRIARFIKAQGAVPGIQLAHAGRKASVYRPWSGQGAVPESEGGWRPVGPSGLSFGKGYAAPEELSVDRILALQCAFVAAANRAYAAGFRTIEIHAAHGYLFHQFSLRSAIVAPTLMAARSITARGSCSIALRLSEANCPSTVRYWCAFPQPTGPTAAGTSNNLSSYHNV
jgi:2,4-dienoyl-CoA reductase-like NADH-dependent reductase (Old Yellow Enzyme family)